MYRNAWPDDKIAKFKNLLSLGLSQNQIGKELGCSGGSVSAYMSRNKIKSTYKPVSKNKWEEVKLTNLKALVGMDLTAREIGERIGCSRNAVLGKLLRLKLPLKKPTKINNGRTRSTGQYLKTQKNNDRNPTQPLPDRNLCHWPTGDTWCGCDTVNGKPYCSTHCATAYNGKCKMKKGDLKKLLGLR